MKDAQACDEELLRKLDSAASPEVSGMLNRYFVAALCESAAARLRFKDAAIYNLSAEVERLREALSIYASPTSWVCEAELSVTGCPDRCIFWYRGQRGHGYEIAARAMSLAMEE